MFIKNLLTSIKLLRSNLIRNVSSFPEKKAGFYNTLWLFLDSVYSGVEVCQDPGYFIESCIFVSCLKICSLCSAVYPTQSFVLKGNQQSHQKNNKKCQIS